MKQRLRQIYDDVSNGRLSQKEALEKVKAIKLQEQDREFGALLAIPVWKTCGIAASAGGSYAEYTEHHVVLCELATVDMDKLDLLLPHGHYLSLQGGQRSIEQRYSDHALACLERIQAILKSKPQGQVLVQVVVANHQEQALFAGFSGLLQTAALENPRIVGQLILVPLDIRVEELVRYLQDEKIGGRNSLIKYEQDARQVLRWREVPAEPKQPPTGFKDHGVYLISGGLGGLGVLFAKEIVEKTEAKVVLAGRSALSRDKQALLDGLFTQAGRVSYRQVDVGDREQVTQLIAAIKDGYGQLNGILHGAGMIADNFILKKPWAEFSEVLAPKVTGTVNLDHASQDVELDFFVLFSSFAGAMGNLGQADYATANGFMDQFAAYRNQQVAAKTRHGRTRSINWPLWQVGGMSLAPVNEERLQQTTGMQPMQTLTGINAFYRALALPYDQMLVVEGDLARMRVVLLAGRPVQPELSPVPIAVERSGVFEAAAAEVDPDSLVEKTEDYLRRQCSKLLKLPFQKIDPQSPLEKYGIDSILAMKLTNQLEKTFGLLSKTLFFEYQTLRELTKYFIQSHSARLATLFPGTDNDNRQTTVRDTPAETLPPAPATRLSSRRFSGAGSAGSGSTTESEPIAIIGLSGRYPAAVDIDAYWHNLRNGKDCITEVPRERWDWREYFSEDRSQSGHHYSKWGGFIAGVDEFDPSFFGISPKEAKSMDPQERLFLEHSWMAVEDAGYTRASLQVTYAQDLPGQVGVYAGVMYTEYQLFGAEAMGQGKRLGVAGSAASIANRVSYTLNLHGPSVTLDTMCSSSLTAIHFACQDLKYGRTSLAIAGGVNVSIHPNKYLVLSGGQFISGDGHCQSFGEGGDGYIPGEGVGVVVLKRLSEASRDGDHIYGIIRGSALNHGGKTNGYTVPNPHAQTSAIRGALAESHTDARHISYIEAHGTGTKLGDPIEIAALSKAFRQDTKDTEFCLIGSAKSNIGHCESAAGIAGLTKVLLQMQHQQIVPSLHSTQLNRHIDFPRSPFIVNQSLRTWEQPVINGRTLPRIAGISSFGAGGSNAHLIVEEHQPRAQQPMAFANVVIVLSARTAEQLQQRVRDLLDFVQPRLTTLDLVAMAYTLQTGREAMDERLGFVVTSAEQLLEKLQAYEDSEQGIEDAYQGQVKRNAEALSLFNTDIDLQQAIDKWIVNRKLSKLVELWVKGLEVDWSKLYNGAKPQRTSLPTYPFAKERYWIDIAAAGPVAVKSTTTAVLHALLHSNTSDLSEQRYHSMFTGDEFFLADYQVRADDGTLQKALPAVAYLEMARAAIEHASPARPESMVLELRDVMWAPRLVTLNQQISIGLVTNDHNQIGYEIYSQDAAKEIVHCQGRAVLSPQPPRVRLDLEHLKGQMGQGPVEPSNLYGSYTRMGIAYGPAFQAITAIDRDRDQLLAQLRLPRSVEGTSGDYVLHPSLMDGALQACVGLFDGTFESANQPRLAFALESLRIVSPCAREMVAWVRYAPGSQAADDVVKVDIDLCDAQGNVCVQMRGVSWQQVTLAFVERVIDAAATGADSAAPTAIPCPARMRKEIVFVPPTQANPAPVERRKPAAVALAAPGTHVSAAGVSSADMARDLSPGRAPISLSPAPLGAGSAASAVSSARLYDDDHGIFSIDIGESVSIQTPANDMIAQLLQALHRVRLEAPVKVLLITGVERCFARGGREDYNEAVEQQLYQAIVSFPYPVIAVLQGCTIGAGFLFAALCDFMVCNEDAQYGYTDPQRHLYPTPPEVVLFGERFGGARAQDLLYISTTPTGKQLRAKGWTCPMAPGAQVEVYARELASTLATKPKDVLSLLKRHLTGHLVGLVNGLTRVEVTADAADPSNTVPKTVVSPAAYLRLDTPAENVLAITFCTTAARVGIKALVAGLAEIFDEIHQNGYCKAVVLASDHPEFIPETAHAIPDDVMLDFQRIVGESRIPVVAALGGNAKGDAWLISQWCDAAVYSRTGVYSSANIGRSPVFARMAAAIFTHRFGHNAGKEILLTGTDYSGDDLRRRAGVVLVAEQDHVLQTAVSVAESLASLSRAALTSWKQHSATTIRERIRSLPAVKERKDEAPEPQVTALTPIALRSQVVTATAHPGGIVVVKMEDRQAKNMFSDALIEGLAEVFAHIEHLPAYKVVILSGYDHYFASGGTKESLLAIQAGKAKFTDSKIFQLPLDCKLPVIAAMQGHGIGAGWCLGMFADLVLLSEESRYVSPYMTYGFTPGAGATWILADKIGQDLARESLLTAEPYGGRMLKARGLLLPVLPRSEVYRASMALAQQIAQLPRDRAIGLKHQLTAYVHEPLKEAYRLELAMHDKTFVGRSDTLVQIQNHFYQEVEPIPVAPPSHIEPAKGRVDGNVLRAVTVALKTLLASELQMRESDIDENAQFIDLGLDSIAGVTWIRKINEKYRTSIEATRVYSYPTLAQLSRHVKEEADRVGLLVSAGVLAMGDPPVVSMEGASRLREMATERAGTELTTRRSRAKSRFAASAPTSRPLEPIAIIGMAGQFPGAKNLDEFWQNIAEGRNCITQVPRPRWDVNAYYQPGKPVAGKSYCQWIGALDEYDLFDPLFFNISPTEAENMDPQQRLFLQACWHSIENAGYDARVLSGSKCSVFVGCAAGDYHQASRTHQLSAHGFTGSATSILAARISYFLNLQGPCVSVDTACSSSLVAIAQACDSLNSGGSDMALAAGVYVMGGPDMHIRTSQTGMLSPEGKCFTFDQRADGFVPGEGVGVVMLKRLADAQKDGDIICGVIQGWGVNQDGRTNGITAPNPESQTRLEQDVYDKYDIDPANIQLIEAHGTATKLGDPIEVEGLKASFKKYTQNKQYCALGSVKSNIGHCLTAAGIAGVIKLLLALKHKQLPPTINFEQLNEHIDLTDSPFYVNSRLQEWKLNGAATRQAAISSFGFSGTNAHMVIGEYLPSAGVRSPVTVVMQNAKIIVPLSARKPKQLKQKARDLLNLIRKEAPSPDLVEIAYTLQVGRESMEERAGFLVGSVSQLAEGLEAFLEDQKDIKDFYQGQLKRDKESVHIISQDDEMKETIVAKWIAQKELGKLLDLWTKGLELDWNKLYGEAKPRRIGLPEYPFAKERYWIDTALPVTASGELSSGMTTAVLHPLLHANTSDLSEHRFSSTFTGDEFFLTDHRVRTGGRTAQKIFPGVAYLEMARAAVEHAWPLRPESSVLELHETIWTQPIIVTESSRISIALAVAGDDELDYEIYSQESEQEVVHCVGRAVWSHQPARARVDVEHIRQQMQKGRLDPSSVYAAFTQMGLHYGLGHQGITALYLGQNQLLAELRLPAGVETGHDGYVLHPSLMDGALQASIRLSGHPTPCLPSALHMLRIISACKGEMLAWVRYSPTEAAGQRNQRLDIDLIDLEGNVCVAINGLEFSPIDVSEMVTPAKRGIPEASATSLDGKGYLCKWEQQPDLLERQQQSGVHETVVIVCCAPFSQLEATILDYYQQRNCKTVLIRPADATKQISEIEWSCGIADPEAIGKCLQTTTSIDTVYFLAMGERQTETGSLNDFADSRESNEIQFVRLVKYLQQTKTVAATVDFYILTLNSHSLTDIPNDFMGSGVTGLGYSLAQWNSKYRVRNLDLSANDLQSQQGRRAAFGAIIAEPPSNRGECYKLCGGRRYRQTFFKLEWDTTSASAIRHSGAYAIVGGTGTLGRIITRNLIRKYGATVIWIGRSPEGAEKVQKSLKSFEEQGARPRYIQADVTDLDAMQKAVRLLKERGLVISGAIFAAMVFSTDNSIEAIAEGDFRNIFDIKAQGSWAFYTALKTEPLDFMCYFSSRQAYAFVGASKYSAYGSGVTFSDAFVRSLQNVSPFPVGTINWGAWKSTLHEVTEGMMADSSDAVGDQEGYDCFELFVAELQRRRVHQCLCVGESRLLGSVMNRSDERITLTAGPVSSRASLSANDIAVPWGKIATLKNARAKRDELEAWFIQLLYCQVHSMIQSSGHEARLKVSDLTKRCGIIDKYVRWWDESLDVLRRNGYLELMDGVISDPNTSDAGSIRDSWQSQKERYSRDPDFRAVAILASDCMERLPDILQGRLLATDVIFPNSSMEKVEGIYKNSTLPDTFNEIAANSVVAYVEQRLQSDPKALVRILEIGAGTGGTSAVVFAKLRPYQASIEEYCYTDLSKAFFFHVEEKYLPEYPYIRCRRLDIEQPIEGQGIDIGSFDLVLASNVLHATRNIRRTVRNAKAILRSGGFFVLEEISSNEIYAHLAFGLLEGWWLYEDAELRIPNCPGLFPSNWQQLLEEEGFASVLFPAKEANDLGYQIIVAQSDGIVRQQRVAGEVEQSGAVPPPATKMREEIQEAASAVSSSPNAQEHVSTSILECMCDVLKIGSEEIDADIAFSDYGIDSILGGKFIEQINSRLAIRLNTAVVFEYPSLARLSQYVMEAHRDQIESHLHARGAGSSGTKEIRAAAPGAVQKRPKVLSRRRPAPVPAPPEKRRLDEAGARRPEIAVIGMSGMFPKAENVDDFWANLVAGVDAVEELPARYLDQHTAYSAKKQPGKTRCKWGGVLKERDCFDPLFFSLSPKEAESMNPHQRLVLQEGWKAIEDASYNPRRLSGSQTGIFIGAEPTGYVGESFTGYSDAIIASRLSYVLNLNGPAFVINTGCSSSAVAIHLACESLRNGETDLALAGGANACMKQTAQISLDEIEMLSPSGRSRTFDSAADGTIISEGVAVVVLKRLDDAVRAGDLIYGVIIGSGINQDGASNGITAPNGAAQEQLITKVYEKFAIDPEKINYVEAHGTGTKLGDPVEGNALVRAFRRFTEKKGYCAVGSAKSHIGHTGAAAGVTGLIKILLSMQHARIPRLLHFKALNPLIEFDGSPFYVGAEESEWKSREGSPRMAALNAFGHSGTNAHLVVREYLEPAEDHDSGDIEQSGDPVFISLSAKTTEQLRQRAIDLLDFIRAGEKRPTRRPEALNLRSLGYTLQTGREAMEERLGFIVSSVAQLASKLQSYTDGKQNIDGVRQGRAKRKKDALALLIADGALQETIDQWIREKRLSKLLELWVQGVDLDWGKFYDGAKPRRMRLPVYPFANERYWVDGTAPVHLPDNLAALTGSFESVEDVIDKLEQGLMDDNEGVRALRLMVS
jgi:acyl transferase domain-containing protein/enoyl-CoA hydratase/carnithine racemase/acyl carrier protein/SAM-dependent methyltransferase